MSAEAGLTAAAAAVMQTQEEEEMTSYTPKDLAENWEFKILRSNSGAFRKPEKLRAVLEQESRGGWMLVEKFDDCRIRLKRPAGFKVIQGDFEHRYDPYRTSVGMSQGALVMTFLGFSVAIALVPLLIFILAVRIH